MKRKTRPATDFGRRLREARLAKRLTQQQVADRILVDRTTYTKYEARAVEPSLRIAYELAHLLGTTLDDLLKP